MSHPTIVELYSDHYDTLDEGGRVAFLVNLKRGDTEEAWEAFEILGQRWLTEPIAE